MNIQMVSIVIINLKSIIIYIIEFVLIFPLDLHISYINIYKYRNLIFKSIYLKNSKIFNTYPLYPFIQSIKQIAKILPIPILHDRIIQKQYNSFLRYILLRDQR